MPIADGAVVGSPVIHHIIGRLESTLSCGPGCKPGAGPCIVSTLPKHVRHFVRQLYRVALADLQHGAQTFHQIQPDHGHRHGGSGHIPGGEAASPEVTIVRLTPGGGIQAGFLIRLRHLPEGLHNALALLILHLAAGIQAGSAGVDQMQEAPCLFCHTLQLIASGLLHRLRTPVSAHIRENLRSSCEQLHKQHTDTV